MQKRSADQDQSAVRQRHLSLSDDVWTRLRVAAAIKGVGHSQLAEEILRDALVRMGRVVDDGLISLAHYHKAARQPLTVVPRTRKA